MRDLRGEVDVALIPIWGWGPSLGPGHLDPEGAARAIALVQPRIAIPIHWGTFLPYGVRRGELLIKPPREFLRHMARTGAVDARGDARARRLADAVGDLAQLGEPAAQDVVHGRGADHIALGPRQLGRVHHERVRLPAAHAAVGADELLEGRDLLELVPVVAVDDDVRAVLEAVGHPHVVGGVGPERRQRVDALDRVVAQRAPAFGPEHDRRPAARSARARTRSPDASAARPAARDGAPRAARASRGPARAGTRSARGCRRPSPRPRGCSRRAPPRAASRRPCAPRGRARRRARRPG